MHQKNYNYYYYCSKQSLVHAIVAEQLNSSSCQDRLVACRLLPRLQGTLNKVSKKAAHSVHVLNFGVDSEIY